MARIKQSICVPMFHLPPVGMGMEEICRAAAKIGYPAVEFWGQEEGFDDQVATAKRHGLTRHSRPDLPQRGSAARQEPRGGHPDHGPRPAAHRPLR